MTSPTTAARSSQNWTGLHPAQAVIVQEPVGEPYPATIDAVTEDSSVIWVIAESDYQRRAFDHREGIVITPA
jgi:hypothetical protein